MNKIILIILSLFILIGVAEAQNPLIFENKRIGISYVIDGKKLDLEGSIQRLERRQRIGTVECSRSCKENLKEKYEVSDGVNTALYASLFVEEVKKNIDSKELESEVKQEESNIKLKESLNLNRYKVCFKSILPQIQIVSNNNQDNSESKMASISNSILASKTTGSGIICGEHLGSFSKQRIRGLISNFKLYKILSNLNSINSLRYLALVKTISTQKYHNDFLNHLLKDLNNKILIKNLSEFNYKLLLRSKLEQFESVELNEKKFNENYKIVLKGVMGE